MTHAVQVRREKIVIPTYHPASPDKNPMFLEKRVYQGSSGRVYPLPIYNRIEEESRDKEWDSVVISNGLVEVVLLPEIGGRVHAIKDLTNEFDIIYRQNVIKPALVSLSGPWASGGIEFNWPQHHRPSTFMPTQVAIEKGDDGSITVWMGEHEPMDRTKGMHGICLYPDRNIVEIKARLYNRTPYTQTFLWWANIGVAVHEGYKSFFPPDAHLVADHAKRAISTYPLCEDYYYGVDYGTRAQDGVHETQVPSEFVPAHLGGVGPDYSANDLSWYANIPVPTSYMCLGTKEDFLGGYDFFNKAGMIVAANHHIAPGKKQWTWGNHDFGYAWDRNLTDSDGPYIELMAGVYTDNQPDFSYIAPGETKTFSQFIYPYQSIGTVKYANLDAAISLEDDCVGAAVTREITGRISVAVEAEVLEFEVQLGPDAPWVYNLQGAKSLSLESGGRIIAFYQPVESQPAELQAATEPPLPTEVSSNDELFVIGQHLMQYRHATRCPSLYWKEALRRDPGDSRCANGLGLWHFRRGEFAEARDLFSAAISRLISRNPNPYDGEPYYNLGLALRFLGQDDAAKDAFWKSSWNAAWQSAAFHCLGELAAKQGDFKAAVDLLDKSLRKDQDNLRAANLKNMLQQKLGLPVSESEALKLDMLDSWALWLKDSSYVMDNQTRIDLAIDLMRAGLNQDALSVLEPADIEACDGTVPMVFYYRAYLLDKLGQDSASTWQAAGSASPDYCFPARLEDIDVLLSAPEDDARAAFYLGCLLYDKRRHHEAVALWKKASELEPGNAVAHRCLGIACFNILGEVDKAKACYQAAINADPNDSRLLYERDQLWKRTSTAPDVRLKELEPRLDLVNQRDDLTIEYCSLLNDQKRSEEAAEILSSRRFQPWEGGEGMALGIYTRTQLALVKNALEEGRLSDAETHCRSLVVLPQNLGEARHVLANASDVWLMMGDVLDAQGRRADAEAWWRKAAEFRGDFQGMAVQPFSEYTFFQAQARQRLGRNTEAEELLTDLVAYAEAQLEAPAKIDYFATSLPTMLLFEDDLKARQDNRARLILAQAAFAMGDKASAKSLLSQVLAADPNYAMAADLLASL